MKRLMTSAAIVGLCAAAYLSDGRNRLIAQSPLQRPGMAPPAPFWLNTDSLFAVQQWPCAADR